MKRRFLVLLFLVFIVGITSFTPLFAASGPTPENPLILTYEFWLPTQVGSWKYVESFFNKLEEITGGAVKVEYHTGGSLGKPYMTYA